MYVPRELNGGEASPGRTVTTSGGLTRLMITVVSPLFLTWKLATQCTVSENNQLGRVDMQRTRHSLKMKMGVCGYCNHDMKENEFLGGVRPVGGFL